MRESGDAIEIEGIRRSRRSLENAEIILHVLDSSEPLSDADRHFLSEFSGKKRILVRNKTDLPQRLVPIEKCRSVDVSSLTGEGIENLKDAIKQSVWSGEIRADQIQAMINSRHQDALNRARAAAQRTIRVLLENSSIELAALDLRIAVSAVGEIVGKTTTEDLLDSIFGQFCIGK